MSSRAGGDGLAAPRTAHDMLPSIHRGVQREVLPNGLTLLMRRDPSAPVVAIVTHVKVGYFDEPDEVAGIAHVLEHMYFKGTPTRGVGTMARDTKALGGYLNAHTTYDHTTYYTVLPSSALTEGLDIQFDAFARSSIDDGELARELEVIIQEANRKRDSPGAVTVETLYAVLHDQHRIRRWRIGEEAILRTLRRSDVMAFYQQWYRPSNTILSIVGDIDPDAVLAEVVRRHGTLADQSAVRDYGPGERTLPGVRLREWTGDVALQHTALGWRGLPLEHADAPSLDLIATTLGTGRASRLYRTIRDQQLASSAGAFHSASGNVGVFTLHAEGRAATARAAAERLWRELQAVRLHGFQADEVTRAQRILHARLLRRWETMDGQATWLAQWEALGGIERGLSYHERVQLLTVEELQRAAQLHLDPQQVSVVSLRPVNTPPLAESAEALMQGFDIAMQTVQRPAVRPLRATPPTLPSVEPPLVIPRRVSVQSATSVAIPAGEVAAVAMHRQDNAMPDVHVHVLPSGVTVLILPRPGAPLVSLGVFQRSGAAVERAGQEGLMRLAAQAMLKGTTTRTGAQIAEMAEELGASIGVSVGMESVGWSLSVPTQGFQRAVMLLADVTQRPVFPDDAVQVERNLALAELTRLRDDMYRWPMHLALAAAFGTHPYARPVLGTPDALTAIDAVAVRAFHAQQILNAPSLIAVVGDIDAAKAFDVIAQEFGSLRHEDIPPLHPALWPAGGAQVSESRDKQQTAMLLLFPGAGRTEESRFAARVTSAIASGLGGRFFDQLRDRQSLAYTVAAYPVERRANGAFAAYIATAPEREAEARAGLLGEFEKLRTTPPDEDELARARNYLIGTHAIGQQTGAAILGELVDGWMAGDPVEERNRVAEHIRRVTAQDVHAFAVRHFDPARVVEGVVRGSGGG